MTQSELEACFKLLRSYWPGEWDEARYLVWAEAFYGLDFDTVRDAIVTMGRREDYPTVAKFLALVTSRQDRDGYFAEGSGLLREWSEIRCELGEPPASREAVVVSLAEARKALRRTEAS